jgi:hypothetical protein
MISGLALSRSEPDSLAVFSIGPFAPSVSMKPVATVSTCTPSGFDSALLEFVSAAIAA